jgi:hypothetical protein
MEVKHDLADLRTDLRNSLELMRNAFELTRGSLELKMSEHKSEVVRWVFLCILGQSAMLLGIGYFLFSHISV